LLCEFENIAFKDGESIDEFGMRISNLAAKLKTMGETVEDSCVIKKFLRVVPSRFSPVVVSIEMFCDMKKMTVEDSRVIKKFLRVVPSRFSPVVVSIEMFCDMKKMTVEELVGRLRAAEERL
jgi:hypothetical protein